jgi:cytochrome c oxidase cbb3-type subunit III
MSSRYREFVLLAVACVVLSACTREERRFTENQPPRMSAAIAQSDLQVGSGTLIAAESATEETQAFTMSEGKRLYEWFNCKGCHAEGGGAIGPALMDDKWIYGNAPENIFATIVEGRPNGMPSFRGRIADREVWQIVAYVRSLSGEGRKDAAPSRSDHLYFKPSEQQTPDSTPRPAAESESTQR